MAEPPCVYVCERRIGLDRTDYSTLALLRDWVRDDPSAKPSAEAETPRRFVLPPPIEASTRAVVRLETTKKQNCNLKSVRAI